MTEIVDYIALPFGDVAGFCLRQWARPEETWLMVGQSDQRQASGRLRCGIVLNVQEDVCRIIVGQGELIPVSFATQFPSPRTERVAPGHLVAVATAQDGSQSVVWRWYDAVVIGEDADLIRLWEPSHGDVLAQPRNPHQPRPLGTRAYLSAGLPGADWWVAGAASTRAEDADVELDEVERFCTKHDL